MFDAIPFHSPEKWTLRTPSRVWTLDELVAFDDRLTATLDCTGGFYSTQEWSGVRLDRLLPRANRSSIRVISSTGYDRRFPAVEASSLLLATRFGDTLLDPGHGSPARLVAPDRRGFWWVITMVGSLIPGGWAAARSAGIPSHADSALHGLFVWSVVLLAAQAFGSRYLGVIFTADSSGDALWLFLGLFFGAAAAGTSGWFAAPDDVVFHPRKPPTT